MANSNKKYNFFTSLLGTIIGASAALIGVWLTDCLHYQRDIDNWFFERYIDIGINHAMMDIGKVKMATIQFRANYPSVTLQVDKLYPVNEILGSSITTECILKLVAIMTNPLKPFKIDENIRSEVSDICDDLENLLNDLKVFIIAFDISSKKDIFLLSKKPKVIQIRKKMEEISEQLSQFKLTVP